MIELVDIESLVVGNVLVLDGKKYQVDTIESHDVNADITIVKLFCKDVLNPNKKFRIFRRKGWPIQKVIKRTSHEISA